MSSGKNGFPIFVAMLVGIILLTSAQSAVAQNRKLLRWATSPVGSYGYSIATSITKIMENTFGGEYVISVNPYPSTTLSMRAVMDGNGEIAYTADIGMSQFQRRAGGFTKYNPRQAGIGHTWYAYPMESMIAVLASTADRFKCWRDFSGQPVYYTNAGFMNWLNWQRVFTVLGYNFKHLQIDLTSNTRSLQTGTIVGSAIYTTAGHSLADYWRGTEGRLDLKIINPCPDEIERMKAAGLSVVSVDPKAAFTRNIGLGPLLGVPILFGYNARLDVPEDVVYRLIRKLYDEKDNLAKANAGFGPMARDFIGMQVAGISANPDMAVHSGLAHFLKEHKAWNDKWKVE
jgi:TRAP-type uncharacterized transport system substrate-binding protein